MFLCVFSGMHPQQHPQYMNPEQMKMHQMYRDQQQRHMQTYMNRPPPEYKVPPGGMPAGNYGVPNGMGNANPMQNMQKMVNQTNIMPRQDRTVCTPRRCRRHHENRADRWNARWTRSSTTFWLKWITPQPCHVNPILLLKELHQIWLVTLIHQLNSSK